jgi:hypothetical protein
MCVSFFPPKNKKIIGVVVPAISKNRDTSTLIVEIISRRAYFVKEFFAIFFIFVRFPTKNFYFSMIKAQEFPFLENRKKILRRAGRDCAGELAAAFPGGRSKPLPCRGMTGAIIRSIQTL